MSNSDLPELKIADHHFPEYVADGLIDLAEMGRVYREAKARDIVVSHVGGVHRNYLSQVEGDLNPYTAKGRENGYRISNEWRVIGIPGNVWNVPLHQGVGWVSEIVKGYALKHVHMNSRLCFPTARLDKLEWVCHTCCEPAPVGVLWMARNESLRRAK